MKVIHNSSNGGIHFWNQQKNERLNLVRGANEVSDEQCKLFKQQIAAHKHLSILDSMSEPAKEAPKSEVKLETINEPKKRGRKKEDEQQINEKPSESDDDELVKQFEELQSIDE